MKETIWKYTLQHTSVQHIAMPIGAKILSLQMQGNDACVWALVNPERSKTPVCFEIFGTGHEILPELPNEKRIFIGTYQDSGFVFHVFTKT